MRLPAGAGSRRRGGRDRAHRLRGRRPRGRAPHAGGPRRGGVLAAVSVGDGRDDLDVRRHQRRRPVPVPPPAGRGAGIVRIGLVGAGAIAARHISVLATIPEVEIAGVCDRDLARANRLAETAGAPVFDSWTSMLDAAALDAVFVCTPPGAHAAVAAAVLERGTAAYVEKPLARTAEDGRTIVGAWQSSGAVCAVGYQWRSLDLLQQIRTLLGEAPPGMLVSRSIAATERARGDRAQAAAAGGSWFVDPVQSGGILFELGSHDIDLQAAIAGPAASVQAVAGSGLLALSGIAGTPLQDAVAVVIRLATGALGAVLVAWTEVDRPA